MKKSWCDWLRRDKAAQAGGAAPKASSDGTKTLSNAMSSHFHRYHHLQGGRWLVHFPGKVRIPGIFIDRGEILKLCHQIYFQQRVPEERSNTFSRERFCHKVWKWMQWGGVEQILQRFSKICPKFASTSILLASADTVDVNSMDYIILNYEYRRDTFLGFPCGAVSCSICPPLRMGIKFWNGQYNIFKNTTYPQKEISFQTSTTFHPSYIYKGEKIRSMWQQ